MSLVWRKIQRSNKKAAKYKFDCQLQELNIHCGRKWQPQKVAVAWVHRRRRCVTKDHQWEPSITDPYRGIIVWPPEEPANLEIVTTLYRDSRQQTFDDKEWTFIVEGVSTRGKRKPLAGINLNLRLFVNELPGTRTELQLKLNPMCEHVDFATMKLILSCQMLKEGNALDDDMQSVASAMSVSHHKADIAELADLDNMSPGESSHSMNATQSPATSPDDVQSMPLPAEIASIATEIADAWRDRSPKPSPTPPPAPMPPAAAAAADASRSPFSALATTTSTDFAVAYRSPSGNQKSQESRSPRPSWTTKEVPEKISAPKTLNVTPQPDALNELPSAGADLLSWCQAVAKGYRGVNIVDFSKCWRNGLAFCAIIHRFKPDLIGNFDTLNPDDVRSNCKKAFDAAATLGVPKLIDPEEMVIMVVPDKIAVTSYVYNLRAILTGQNMGGGGSSQRNSITSPWSSTTTFNRDEWHQRESGSTKSSESPTLEERRKSPASVKSSSRGGSSSKDKSPSPSDHQKPLMTRNQLMNPFDSDGEDGKTGGGEASSGADSARSGKSTGRVEPSAISSPTSPTPVATPVASTPIGPSMTTAVNGGETRPPPAALRPLGLMPLTTSTGDRQADLQRRAKMLLQQYNIGDKQNDVVSPEDEKRRQQLQHRARQLIEEHHQQRPSNVVKMSDELVRSTITNRSTNHPTSSSSAPSTRQTTPEHRKYIAQSFVVTKESLKSAVQQQQADGGAFDRFKRFGSMRTQELSQSINLLSSRYLYQTGRRSASEPRELVNRAQNGTDNEHQGTETYYSKPDDTLQSDTRNREEILAEIDQIAERLRILDQKAMEVERRVRKAGETSSKELENTLMGELLSLLKERNMLVRHEASLNILEQIREHEERFKNVQDQLAELMMLDDFEKTELHKLQIDKLMDQLITIVNRRDELAQQLIAHEQGTQEDQEQAQNVANQSTLINVEDQKNCSIM